MIQGTPPGLQVDPPGMNWQSTLARAITDPAELLERLELPLELLPAARRAAEQFGLKVPAGFLSRIEPGNPADPLLRQVLPLGAELDEVVGYSPDPVGDQAAMLSPGLLQKYPGRALLLATGACGIHCRYCFRRHLDYAAANPARQEWQAALAALRADASIHEIILSGGDPLNLADAKLAALVEALGAIPHLQRLRIHTRLAVVLPERVNDALCSLLTTSRLKPVVVLHINHASEIDESVASACQRLSRTGVMLLNQSVLLAGVNDDVAALSRLSERLADIQVLPYYLHQLDAVAGAAHFAVADDQARQLVAALRDSLPGYLVPRLVREVAAATSKLPL